tara:strand:+ start:278 stop:934 length:657 start_codon:yes stop_codon:yes gene_type:complete
VSDNLGKVWSQVSSTHRHLPRNAAVIKNEEIILSSLRHCKITDVGNVLDWGPGGGWLSRAIGAKNVNFVDVVPDYDIFVQKTQENYIENMKFHTLSGSEMPKITDKIDTVILYSVLYHMPSLEYVRRVIEYVTSLNPKVILIRSVFTDASSWERPDRYDSKTYIRGNIYNKDEFLSLFDGYEWSLIDVDKNLAKNKNEDHSITADISSYSCVMCLTKT